MQRQLGIQQKSRRARRDDMSISEDYSKNILSQNVH
jgi:hypothetical protein